MEYSEELDAEAARHMWLEAQWQPTFTSIDELLESDSTRPELPTYEDTHLLVWRQRLSRFRDRLATRFRP